MAGGAVALALGAAVAHAVWNLLLARARDSEASTALALASGVCVFALPALLTWRVEPGAWPYVAASAAFEIGYVATRVTRARAAGAVVVVAGAALIALS